MKRDEYAQAVIDLVVKYPNGVEVGHLKRYLAARGVDIPAPELNILIQELIGETACDPIPTVHGPGIKINGVTLLSLRKHGSYAKMKKARRIKARFDRVLKWGPFAVSVATLLFTIWLNSRRASFEKRVEELENKLSQPK